MQEERKLMICVSPLKIWRGLRIDSHERDRAFQFYLYGLSDRKTTPHSDGKSRNTEPVWSNSGEAIINSSSPPKGNRVGLSIINPFVARSNRLLVESTRNYLRVYDWSPDDNQ